MKIEQDVSEWDELQWAIEDTLTASPLANSHSLGPDTDLLYFQTWAHPGLSHLAPVVVVFRIDFEPIEDTPGLLEGHFVFTLGDLNGGFAVASSPLD